MDFKETELHGVYIIENMSFNDSRGNFLKLYNFERFKSLECDFKEIYYSVSKKDVIRGMHFQNPPYEHSKLVHVIRGAIIDVVLDIRKGSPTYGKFIKIDLSENNHKSVYMPPGYAHGFKALKDDTIVLYAQTSVYNAESDSGVRWNTFGMDWGIINPVISQRDVGFVEFSSFKSSF